VWWEAWGGCFPLGPEGWCVPVISEGMRVLCSALECFHESVCAGWYCMYLWGRIFIYGVE